MKSIAAAAAATHAAAAKAGFAGEVHVLDHGFHQRITIIGHHRLGEVAALVGLDANELLGTAGETGDADREE